MRNTQTQRYWRLSALSSLLAAALLAPVAGAAVSDQDIVNDSRTPGDVVSYGMGPQAQRFSSLSKINSKNVAKLVPAWSLSFGGEKQRGQEAQPLVVDGVIYVTASYSRAYAVDARTGRKLWEYNARLPDGIMPCCDVINRGMAIYGDLVYFGTLDARLIALDRHTGKVVWTQKVGEYKEGYSYTAAPMVVKGKLITGVSGGEFGIVGKVEARDAKTGELVWSRPVIEGHMGTLNGKESTMTGKLNASWEGDQWKHGGGATWLGGTYDPETDTIFMGTGNPAPWNSWTRKGDNLYTASTLALNPDTGEIKWHLQTTPHDGWDYDGVNEFVPFDLKKDGKVIKAGAKADRNGFFFVADRTNGDLLGAYPFVSKITWAKGFDLKTKRPIYNDEGRPTNPFDPATQGEDGKGKPVFAAPSFLGGKNWMPMAYSPKTELFYVPSNEWGMDIWNEPISYKKGGAYLGAGFTIKPLYDDHIGVLRAMDPKTGKIKWEYKNPAPLWAGVMTTAGNLVFTGTPEGYLKAFDAQSGKQLWQFQTGSGIVGSPVTWEMDGQQYVAVVSGWGGAVPLWGGEVAKRITNISQGGSLWVFKLSQ
ncbi:PQQ-dependent methanol/ethanol family dehydrogenase [Vogesella sp. LIG4]|uniref:PQQ-dependent methanol/ethanol family dehydrogenase n=1 Tax=Vogesella sp. LIG4 TaxID=1192162 RepID=UPI0008201941|nr:PQQ-dependent methanol/ethanol family dehydrogenase [Vogesella sp. LIG4]SCK05174.1 alcohol dehydrogenase (cytochrome c) [Vogesella sp. LIG4]